MMTGKFSKKMTSVVVTYKEIEKILRETILVLAPEEQCAAAPLEVVSWNSELSATLNSVLVNDALIFIKVNVVDIFRSITEQLKP